MADELVLCPYCHKNWIDEEDDIVCLDCKNDFDRDQTIMSINISISELTNLPREKLIARKTILKDLSQEFQQLLKRI